MKQIFRHPWMIKNAQLNNINISDYVKLDNDPFQSQQKMTPKPLIIPKPPADYVTHLASSPRTPWTSKPKPGSA